MGITRGLKLLDKRLGMVFLSEAVNKSHINSKTWVTQFANLRIAKKFRKQDPEKSEVTRLKLSPKEGIYTCLLFEFKIIRNLKYPSSLPTVQCLTPVFHPNIDEHGNVSLKNMRSYGTGSSAAQSMRLAVLECLLEVFTTPTSGAPLNKEAANMLDREEDRFGHIVAEHMLIKA